MCLTGGAVFKKSGNFTFKMGFKKDQFILVCLWIFFPSWFFFTEFFFLSGFFHVHGIFDNYPFEKSQNMLTRKFQRGYWPNSDENYFYTGRQAHAAPLVPCF